ncbi:MAG: penicillin acylase family protein, partial [Bdellovibrionales bacterium]|nr:penicillin acylase family protein [Bdellovibrionales bacterium]
MTRLRIVILSFIGLVALLFALSWGTGRYWGRDVDTLQSNVEGGKFTAKRDATGVWSVQAADFPNLWFAFGYIHSQDREFQMELMRATATGRLSSWFGTATLPRDRLMRFSARLARREWEGLAPNDPLRQACESFVAGHNEYVKRNAARTPIEYRIFTLKREDIPAWEPWEVLAISRLHSWEFSYDAYEEARSFALSRTLGTEAAKLLLPGEPEDSPELMYRQPLVRGVKPQLAKLRLPLPKFHVPVVAGHASATTHPDTDSMQAYSTDRALNTDLGASNLWMIANPRTALEPTLCNDTHLSLSWPGALYPIRYQVGDIDAQGFSLPGTPGIVIGRVDRPGSNFVWGITLANYGDTQDLITVSSATIQKATKFEESFQVRDPKTFALSTQVFSEQWTQWGPRVDEVFDWKGTTPKEPVALDWFGFRETVSPMGFYMRRNMQGAEGLRDDLAKAWMFPAVNFTWIDRNAKDGTRFGHVMTGLLFDRERKGPRELLSEKDAAARKISQPAERPYLDYDYKGQEMFFTTTANQGAFAQPLGKRLAYEWGDRSRAKRILATLNEAVTKPEYAQTDYLSQNILEFVKRARERLSADRLCALGESEYLTSCFEVVSAMDRWDGTMAANRWEPTLAALWYVKTKQALWTGKLPAS